MRRLRIVFLTSIVVLLWTPVSANTSALADHVKAIRGTEYSSQYSWKQMLPFKVTASQERFNGLSAPRRVDLNADGVLDWFLVGGLNPKNKNWVGKEADTFCGKDRCVGVVDPIPLVYMGQKGDENYTNVSHLFVDNREVKGVSMPTNTLLSDFNGDGKPDFFITDHGFGGAGNKGYRDSYYLSQPDGTWLESSSTHLSNPDYLIFDHGGQAGDIDSDGDVDIVLTNLKGYLTCWMNDGRGKMSLVEVCGSGTFALSIDLGDFNGDGCLDVVHAANDWMPSKQHTASGIILGDCKGNFNQGFFGKNVTKLGINHGRQAGGVPHIYAYDLNNDGLMDIVASRVGELYVGTFIEILLNKGNMKFESTLISLVETPKGYQPQNEGNEWNHFVQHINFEDIDSDGDIDLVLFGGGWTPIGAERVHSAVMLNDSKGHFKHLPYGEEGNPTVRGINQMFPPSGK